MLSMYYNKHTKILPFNQELDKIIDMLKCCINIQYIYIMIFMQGVFSVSAL